MNFNNFYIIPNRNEMDSYIELSKEYGFKFEYNDFFMPFNLDKDGFVDEAVQFYKSCDGMPVGNTMHGSFLDVTIFSRDEKIRKVSEERLRESMTIAKRLGVRAVIIHTNFIPNFIDDAYEKYWLETNSAFIRKLLVEFPELSIYMENMFDMEPRLLLSLAEELKDEERFGICLDYAHVNVFGKAVAAMDWLNKLAPYIKHIHINDNDLLKDSHEALGKGKIDYKAFFDFYEKKLKDIPILLEMNGIEKIKESVTYLKVQNFHKM